MIDRRHFIWGAAALATGLSQKAVEAREHIGKAGWRYVALRTFAKDDGGPFHVDAPFCLASDGALYGVCGHGGAHGGGCIFRMASDGSTENIHDFHWNSRSYGAGLIQGADGRLYGTVGLKHEERLGVAFAVDLEGQLEVIHSFNQGAAGHPSSSLLEASDGLLYGTTYDGGPTRQGSVYRISPQGGFEQIHAFKASPRAHLPSSELIEGADGMLYGTTSGDLGSVFCMDKDGVLVWLRHMGGPIGSHPVAALTRLRDGTIYGVTRGGETDGHYGTIFRLGPKGQLILVRTLGNREGGELSESLIEGSDGNLYLATPHGTKSGIGGVLQLTRDDELTVVYSLRRKTDGWYPNSRLVQDSAGRLIGTTSLSRHRNAGGMVYAMTPV